MIRPALLLLLSGFALQAEDPVPVTSPEKGWPQWRGPRRDGVSDEKGLLASWPEGGPTRLWRAEGLGRGYSSPIVADGNIFITGDQGDELMVMAFTLDGTPRWKTANGAAWKTPYPGARATCAYSAGKVYNLNAHGRLACFNAEDGAEQWGIDVLARYGGKNITWALSEGVVVDGDQVLVTVGGTEALMVALDKSTGELVWKSPPLQLGPSPNANQQRLAEPAGEVDGASYASPVLFTLGGRKQAVNASLRHLFGVDAETGALLWTRPLKTTYAVIAATPVVVPGGVFGTAPDGDGGMKVALKTEGGSLVATTAWRSEVDTCQGSLIAVGHDLFAPWYRGKRGWVCLDARSGEQRYETRELAIGSAVYADGRLFVLGQDGEAVLLRPGRDGFAVQGRFALTPARVSDAWAHPVLLDGRLYLRYHDQLHCFAVGMP